MKKYEDSIHYHSSLLGGSSITEISKSKEDKYWTLGAHDEYASLINFCPYCGKKLNLK